jgi:hypothetical protein
MKSLQKLLKLAGVNTIHEQHDDSSGGVQWAKVLHAPNVSLLDPEEFGFLESYQLEIMAMLAFRDAAEEIEGILTAELCAVKNGRRLDEQCEEEAHFRARVTAAVDDLLRQVSELGGTGEYPPKD